MHVAHSVRLIPAWGIFPVMRWSARAREA